MEVQQMTKALPENMTIYCENEYDALQEVILVPPTNMKIEEVINETQEHYLKDNINRDKALQQHHDFKLFLESEGTHVSELPTKEELNEQVYTRDIGFVIEDTLFISLMKEEVRHPETAVLRDWLQQNNLQYNATISSAIEGGDVLVDGKTIWIGNSHRTSRKAIQQLQQVLPNHYIRSVKLREDILHLDCVLTIIGEHTALVYPAGIDKAAYQYLKTWYTVIEVTEEEQFAMGPNVLAIGNNTIVSLPENRALNRKMEQAGFKVAEIAFSEIIKSGGSFRCCTLPLKRMEG